MTSEHKIDLREFRNTLGRFATGVTALTAEQDGQIYSMTANAFMSVSLEPPLVLVSVNHHANIREILAATKRFGVSILAEGQSALSDYFARRPVPAPALRFVERGGMPVLDGAIAYVIARVVEMYPAGDHMLFLGHVEFLEWTDGKPLLYFGGKYYRLKAPSGQDKTAPPDELALLRLSRSVRDRADS